jgi:predicted dehydrogenase
VLVEKPMARTVAECDRMIAAAASTRAVLAVGHDFRHFPIARFARGCFDSGLLGAVKRVDLQQSAGARWPACTPGVLTTRAGGGTLLSFGVHVLDLLSWWFGDLRVIRYADDAAGGVEAECACDLELPGGAPVHLDISRRRALRDTFIVDGDRGTIEIGIHDPGIVRLTLPSAPILAGGIPDPEFKRAPLRTVFARQVADFMAAIEGKRDPLVDGRQGRRVVELVERCYQLRQPLRRPWDFPEAYDGIEAERRRHAG